MGTNLTCTSSFENKISNMYINKDIETTYRCGYLSRTKTTALVCFRLNFV